MRITHCKTQCQHVYQLLNSRSDLKNRCSLFWRTTFCFCKSPSYWYIHLLFWSGIGLNECKKDRSLREKCPNTEFFLVRIFLYSFRIQESMDQKNLRIWTLFTQWLLRQAQDCSKMKRAIATYEATLIAVNVLILQGTLRSYDN